MITENNSHRQVMVRVNVECDKGIAPLVHALNGINGVITLDSCQEGVLGEAYVFFTYGRKWQELAVLLQTISSELSKISLGFGYSLRLEWLGSNEWPRAQIVLLPEHVTTLAEDIWALTKQINAHMTESIGGRSHITLHS